MQTTNRCWIFKDSQYEGDCAVLPPGLYTNIPIGRDTLSSLRIVGNLRVILYRTDARDSNRMICVRDTPYVGDDYNDKIVAIEVMENQNARPIIYRDTNYRGKSQELDEGLHLSLAIGNDALSSLIVPDGYRVTLYSNADQSGDKMICVRDTPDVGGNVGDKISAVRVEKIDASQRRPIVYSDANYTGWSQELAPGTYNGFSIGNDRMSSILVPAGFRVELFADQYRTGKKLICVRDTPRFGAADDEITSAVVEKLSNPCPRPLVYTDAEYGGWSQELGDGDHASFGGGGSDSISSVIIPPDYQVVFYEHAAFGGRRMHCRRDTPRLESANDSFTCARVRKFGANEERLPIVYQDADFTGWSQELVLGGVQTLSIGNDVVSSVIVPAGYRVTLYEDQGYGGRSVELFEDTGSLGKFGDFGDKTTSLRVDKLTAAAAMPTLAELAAMISSHGPRLYLHPDERYRPSSVEWFLQRATLRDRAGSVYAGGNLAAELPSDGSNDGLYWLELPETDRGGELSSACAYVNIKCTNLYWIDLQFWFFYPFNGGGTAKVKYPGTNADISLAPMGQHGGDWEHVTVRVALADARLLAAYLAAHDGGQWLKASDIEIESGHPVVYASKNGHGCYPRAGANLSSSYSETILGSVFEFGLRNDTAKSSNWLDASASYQIIRADFLAPPPSEPSWLKFRRRWGRHIQYSASATKALIKDLIGIGGDAGDAIAASVYDKLPGEAKEENGPTGPKAKGCWNGPE